MFSAVHVVLWAKKFAEQILSLFYTCTIIHFLILGTIHLLAEMPLLSLEIMWDAKAKLWVKWKDGFINKQTAENTVVHLPAPQHGQHIVSHTWVYWQCGCRGREGDDLFNTSSFLCADVTVSRQKSIVHAVLYIACPLKVSATVEQVQSSQVQVSLDLVAEIKGTVKKLKVLHLSNKIHFHSLACLSRQRMTFSLQRLQSVSKCPHCYVTPTDTGLIHICILKKSHKHLFQVNYFSISIGLFFKAKVAMA